MDFSAFDKTIDALLPEIVALRRELHEHPEIRFEEHWTSDRIARFLGENGVPFRRGYAGGTGIVGEIVGNAHAERKRVVALRADIDALEIEEATGVAYASKNPGRMHACGHDGHIAVLCGVAKALAQHTNVLPGTVRLIFQPGEEMAAAGRRMVEEGVVDGADAVFALHAWPSLPAGTIGVRTGAMMAGADWFRIDIRGRGCHGADPAAGVDPVLVAAHITTALQSIVSREVDPRDSAVLTVARISAGTTTNIIPETARVEGTFRTLDKRVRETIARAVDRIATNTAAAFRASATVTLSEDCYVPLVNDPAMTEIVRTATKEALGPEALVELEQPSMASEDFSYYLERVPGSYFRLGVNRPFGPDVSLHTPYFDFNDDALSPGLRVMTRVAIKTLEK